MDRASVAHLFGTCFAEALRERVGENGSVGTGKTAAGIGQHYRIPAEYVKRVTGYAASIGAVEVRELADGSTALYYTESYQEFTRQNLTIDAERGEDRGDYPVSYGPADTRPRTPAVIFPEATKDTVTAGEAEAASQTPRSTRSGQDECERWYQQAISRRAENARIIAARPAPERTDYTADRLAAYRLRMAEQSGEDARLNTIKSEARREWTEADRLINWLYHKPGQAQEIKSLYYERGAHSPEDQERISTALNRLKARGKIRRSRRAGKVYARLVEGVKPRRYTRRELERHTEQQKQHTEQEAEQEADQGEPEQSFDPQVMAEMSAAGASYTESWDS